MDSLPITSSVDHEQAWFNSLAGVYLQENEQALFDAAVFDLFGTYALQMGFSSIDLLCNSRIPNRLVATDNVSQHAHLYCADDFLPFAEMSLDLLLLPHRLEFSVRPHQTLREAARVIMPEGHLIITGFNPWSIWGLKAIFKKIVQYLKYHKNKSVSDDSNELNENYPWNARMIRLSRLNDWLSLLSFEVVSVEVICHAPPLNHERWLKKFTGFDTFCKKYLRRLGLNRFGGVYFIVAKKRVAGMTFLKPKWKNAVITSNLVSRPVTRSKPSHQQKEIWYQENES